MKTFYNNRFKSLVVSVLLLFCVPVLTNLPANNILTQTIRGTVSDSYTSQPLIGATVILIGSNPVIGTITGADGSFKLTNVPIGRQGIEVSYIGYNKVVINNILLGTGKEIFLNVLMEEKAQEVEAITISPEMKKGEARNEMAMISSRSFSVEQTERFAGSLGDPARMVANYAGVMTQNDSRNDIIIRGNSPTGVLWRLEGVEIPNPNHFGALGTTGGPVSMINNNLLANSDFLTGAFPAEFGNALAGAFDLNLRSGNNQKTEFTGQIGFNGFEGGIEGPLKLSKDGPAGSYLANFRYSTLDLLSKMGFDFGTGSAIPQYKDLTFLIDLPNKKTGRIKLFGLAGNSHIMLGYEPGDTIENSYTSRGVATDYGTDLQVYGISHTKFLGEKTRLKSTVSWQRTKSIAALDSTKESGTIFDPWVRSTEQEDKFTVSSQLRRKLDSRNQFSIGFIADWYNINYIDSINNPDYDKFITGTDVTGNMSLLKTYFQYQFKLNESLTSYAGMHFQYSGFNNQLVAEPRLGLKWQVNNNQSVNFGYGLHSQLQPKVIYFNQTYVEQNNSYHRTNENLGFSRSNHFVMGYDVKAMSNMRIKLETYYQYLFEIPVKESFPEFSALNIGDQFGIPREDSLVNEGKGKNYGLELTVEKFLNKGFYFLFTTSLFDSKYLTLDNTWRNTAFNGNYVFNMLVGKEWQLGEKTMLTLDLKTVFAGGRRYIPIDLEASEIAGEEVRDYDHAYENKYDPYFRSDLRIGFKINMRKLSQEWAIDLQNFTGYKSIFMEGYDATKNEVYTVYQQGFYPMFLYRIQF
jgi:hypothetical protein